MNEKKPGAGETPDAPMPPAPTGAPSPEAAPPAVPPAATTAPHAAAAGATTAAITPAVPAVKATATETTTVPDANSDAVPPGPLPASVTVGFRSRRARWVATGLAVLLGLALSVQIGHTRSSGLENLRQSELVGILDGLSERLNRLDGEIRKLERTRDDLRRRAGDPDAAVDAAKAGRDAMGVLSGRLAATGPGVVAEMTDPAGKLTPYSLLDAVQELRDAGAEALQIGPVRIVASTAFTEAEGGVVIDGTTVRSPYVITAIGDAHTLGSALAIPGGVVDTVKQAGAKISVQQHDSVVVSAVREPTAPRHAVPVPATGKSGP